MSLVLEREGDVRLFRTRLLDWYDTNKRELAWRDSGNPYHVWLSEVMLQQTRVEQMGAYFDRFIAAKCFNHFRNYYFNNFFYVFTQHSWVIITKFLY